MRLTGDVPFVPFFFFVSFFLFFVFPCGVFGTTRKMGPGEWDPFIIRGSCDHPVYRFGKRRCASPMWVSGRCVCVSVRGGRMSLLVV